MTTHPPAKIWRTRSCSHRGIEIVADVKGIEIPVASKCLRLSERFVWSGLYSFLGEEKDIEMLDGFDNERRKAKNGKRTWMLVRSSTEVAIIERTVGS